MAERHEFVQNDEGVHLMLGEFTLCGDAFDIYAVDPDRPEFSPTKSRIVTCPRCIAIVRECRRVRIYDAPARQRP